MKKVVWVLFAALLVVALPLSAMAKTEVYNFKDMDVDLWEFCVYAPEPYVFTWGGVTYVIPVGPAYEFGDRLTTNEFGYKAVYIHYVGTEKFNARVKPAGNLKDVGWNRNVHGTAYIYDEKDVLINGGTLRAMEAISAAPKMTVKDAQGSTMSMYQSATPNCGPVYESVTPRNEPLYSGPFQVEEVVQDDGGDFGCFNPAFPAPVNFQDCYSYPIEKIDYLMLHVKITGNKIYFWKSTIHEPGVLQLEDHRGTNVTYTY
jgi:hypothetical protein